MENELEIIKTREQYLQELSNEREYSLIREKNKQNFLLKAEQEKQNLKQYYETKREEKIIENYIDPQIEIFNQRNERISTPNTHIPDELQLIRVKNSQYMNMHLKNSSDERITEEMEYQMGKIIEDPPFIQEFPIDKRLNQSPIKKIENIPEPKNVENIPEPKKEIKKIENIPEPKKEIKKVESIPEPKKEIKKPEERVIEEKKEDKVDPVVIDFARKKTPTMQFPKSVEKIIEASDDDDNGGSPLIIQYSPIDKKERMPTIESNKVPKIDVLKSVPIIVQHESPGMISKDSVDSEFNIDKYIDLPDNSIPTVITSKQFTPVKAPEYKKKTEEESSKIPEGVIRFDKDKEIQKGKKTEEISKEPERSRQKVNTAVKIEEVSTASKVRSQSNKIIEISDEDIMVPIVRKEKEKEKEKPQPIETAKIISVGGDSSKHSGKSSLGSKEVPIEIENSTPKVLKVDQNIRNSSNSKPVNLPKDEDYEFEIKTIRSKPDSLLLKSPEVDIEGSMEDSSQLDNIYIANIIDRNKNASGKASSRKESDLNSSKGVNSEGKMQKETKQEDVSRTLTSPRPEPLSPVSQTSSIFILDQAKLLAENKVLNAISHVQRKKMIEDLSNLVKENFMRTGKKINRLEGELTMQRLEKLYENYIIEFTNLKYKNNEELLGFVLSLGRTIPEPFLPMDLAKSKMPFTETMIKEKLSQKYLGIFVSIKEMLVESIIQNWIDENLACELFTDTLINFMTSKSQYKRCQQHLNKIIKAGLSRPPTAIKDTSFDNSRVVTPVNIGSQRFSIVKASTGGGRQSIDSGIDNFKEVIDEDI